MWKQLMEGPRSLTGQQAGRQGGTWGSGAGDAQSHVWGKAATRIIENGERSGFRGKEGQ